MARSPGARGTMTWHLRLSILFAVLFCVICAYIVLPPPAFTRSGPLSFVPDAFAENVDALVHDNPSAEAFSDGLKEKGFSDDGTPRAQLAYEAFASDWFQKQAPSVAARQAMMSAWQNVDVANYPDLKSYRLSRPSLACRVDFVVIWEAKAGLVENAKTHSLRVCP